VRAANAHVDLALHLRKELTGSLVRRTGGWEDIERDDTVYVGTQVSDKETYLKDANTGAGTTKAPYEGSHD
jgi:hypothetical protein